MAKAITKRQQEIYDYLCEYISEHGFPPTHKEIGKRFEIQSSNAVRDHLNALEAKRLIKKNANCARGIEVLGAYIKTASKNAHAEIASIPLIGSIAAGTPILAEENIEDTLTIGNSFIPRASQAFALRVRGDSMIGDGILNNDIAIIRMQQTAENGQIVAAVIEGEATLKHFHKKENHIELQASNEKYKPIIVSAEESGQFQVAGILSGIIRHC